MNIATYVIRGIALYFTVSRPLGKYKARQYCKERYGNILPKLKWYQWWIKLAETECIRKGE